MPTTLLGILGFKNEQDTDPTVLRLQVFKIFFFFEAGSSQIVEVT